MKYKLSIILTLIIMIFLNISDVGAYAIPDEGKFSWYNSTNSKYQYFDSNVFDSPSSYVSKSYYALSDDTINDYNNDKGNSRSSLHYCYLSNLPTSTNYVVFNNGATFEYSQASSGSTLYRAWKQGNGYHHYMVGCYRTSVHKAKAKYYFMGFYAGGNTSCNNSTAARGFAYVYASQTDINGINVRETDYTYGYGNEKNNLIIGASWACKGKKTNGYEECKKNNGENFTDRDECPMYAGARLDSGQATFYLTDKTDTDFSSFGYNTKDHKLCIGYDKVIEDFVTVTLSNYNAIFDDKTADIEDDYNPGVNMLNVYQLVKSYTKGDITLDEVQNKFMAFIVNIYKEIFVTKGKIIKDVEFNNKDLNSLEFGDFTEFGSNICGDYIDYLKKKVKKQIDIFSKNLANKLILSCINTSNHDGNVSDVVTSLEETMTSRGSFKLKESDFNELGLTSDEKSCLLKVTDATEKVSSVIDDKYEEMVEKWLEKANEFWNTGFSGQGISDKKMTCEDLLGANLVKIVKFVVKLLSIAGAIIAIVNAMISLVPAVVSKDADALKKAQSKCITMAIVLVLILLLPTLLTFIGNIFGYDLSCLQWLSGE